MKLSQVSGRQKKLMSIVKERYKIKKKEKWRFGNRNGENLLWEKFVTNRLGKGRINILEKGNPMYSF